MILESPPKTSPGRLVAKLALLVEELQDDFSPIIVCGWDTALRDKVFSELEQRLPDASLVRVNWLRHAGVDPKRAVLKAMEDARSETPDALLLYNLEPEAEARHWSGEQRIPEVFTELNIQRDELARLFPFPWIFWMSPLLLKDLGRHAPDFYDFRRTVFWVEEGGGETAVAVADMTRIEDHVSVDVVHPPKESRLNITALCNEIERLQGLGTRTRNQSEQYLNLLETVAEVYWKANDAHLALPLAQRALEEARRIKSREWEARSLSTLGNVSATMGNRKEALAATQDAVHIVKELAATHPQLYTPRLAGELNNLGLRFSDLGQREEAMQAAREAVEIYRTLATDNPKAFNPDLAMGLANLGSRFSELGQHNEAKKTTRKAVEIYQTLAADNPKAFNPDLATALNNLGDDYWALDQHEKAMHTALKAVEIYRQLADENPKTFKPDLAGSLNNLGIQFSALGQREEAMQTTREAVEIRRELADENPKAFTPDLARSLFSSGLNILEGDAAPEGCRHLREARDLLTPFHQQLPDAFQDLMNDINNALSEHCPDA